MADCPGGGAYYLPAAHVYDFSPEFQVHHHGHLRVGMTDQGVVIALVLMSCSPVRVPVYVYRRFGVIPMSIEDVATAAIVVRNTIFAPHHGVQGAVGQLVDCRYTVKGEDPPYVLPVFTSSAPAFVFSIKFSLHFKRFVESIPCQLPTGTVGWDIRDVDTALLE